VHPSLAGGGGLLPPPAIPFFVKNSYAHPRRENGRYFFQL
jgi:hypothetical protein